MTKRNDITGAILAGGESSRMGQDKALLELDRKSFIQRIAEVLQEVVECVIIVSDHGERYGFLRLPIYEDIYKNCGPLAGIHSALTNATTEGVFIVSCDMPFLSPEVIRYVIDSKSCDDVTLLSTRNGFQPLCGLYKRGCLPTIEDHLKQGQCSVLQCLQEMQTTTLSPQFTNIPHPLMNVNTPGDYELCLKSTPEQK